MKEEVISLIAEVLEISEENIQENANLVKDLELDSLDLVDIFIALEDKYGIEFLTEDIENFSTVKDIIEYIIAKNV